MTPEQTIRRIAEVANAVAFQAGVGGMEIAGQIVSILARHPERVETFLRDGWEVEDDFIAHAENGCLTFFNQAGKVITPAELYDARQIQNIKRRITRA